VWSNYDAEGYGSMEDELLVFADDGLGASLYMNALAMELELFRWHDDHGDLSIEPLRSVRVIDDESEPQERGARAVYRYALATERTCWDRDKEVLRLEPRRVIGTRFARSALNESLCDALQRHLGFAVTSEGAHRP
jgi:hypothetical protein